jgi:two-component system, OmpR family, sensor histidine kinase MprB
MSLRGRISLMVAVLVAALLVAVGIGLQVNAGRVLLGAVDDDLERMAMAIERDPRGVVVRAGPGRGRAGGAAGLVQLSDADGRSLSGRGPMTPRADGEVLIPVDDDVLALALSGSTAPASALGETSAGFFRTTEVEGFSLRVLAVPFGSGLVLQVARPIDEITDVLTALRLSTAWVTLAGALLAALVAWSVAGRAIRPVTALTARVEGIRGAGDLDARLEVRGSDEVGRLAAAFNGMLGRLESARAQQEQLTADASHELRTPLTSLRTNIEVLVASHDRLDDDARVALLADLLGQVAELTDMTEGLVDLARVDAVTASSQDIDLVALADDVLATAARRHPQRALDLSVRSVDAQSTEGRGRPVVVGDARQLHLALTALIDNAVKYAPSGSIIVEVEANAIRVCDQGPGVAPEHLQVIFDRFYRTPEARSRPGAGLGLALVARVAEAHGGHVAARPALPHGLVVELAFPVA